MSVSTGLGGPPLPPLLLLPNLIVLLSHSKDHSNGFKWPFSCLGSLCFYSQPRMVGVSKRSGCTHPLLQSPPGVPAGADTNIKFPSEVWSLETKAV